LDEATAKASRHDSSPFLLRKSQLSNFTATPIATVSNFHRAFALCCQPRLRLRTRQTLGRAALNLMALDQQMDQGTAPAVDARALLNAAQDRAAAHQLIAVSVPNGAGLSVSGRTRRKLRT
jgi:hypothetical protein